MLHLVELGSNTNVSFYNIQVAHVLSESAHMSAVMFCSHFACGASHGHGNDYLGQGAAAVPWVQITLKAR